MDQSRNYQNNGVLKMGFDQELTGEKREKEYERFREELDELLEKNIAKVHPEDLCKGLISESKIHACFWFGCYLHLIGFLTKNMTEDLEVLFDDIRKTIDKERNK
jgi:hypothetical protein